MALQTPWAILLCKFSDSDAEPYPRKRYEDLFTSSGAGQFNMVDFFREISHGLLDLTGSQVFGWFTLDQKRSDYTGSGVNQKGRGDLITWARDKHKANGVPVDAFYNVVVVVNEPTDLFGGAAGVVCDDGRSDVNGMTNLSPSMLGQEMGHGYGLQHSQAAGSAAPYNDAWDTMSTASTPFMAPHPTWTERDVRGNPIFLIGPGLNAANMSDRGWLDRSRVWTSSGEQFGTAIQLRPLHRTDLPGFLAAQVGSYFVEFRAPQRWDAAIGQAVVLIHDVGAGYSQIYTGKSGRQGLVAGDGFEFGDTAAAGVGPLTRIDVLSIDMQALTASIGITVRKDRTPRPPGLSRLLVGAADGVAIGITPNGKVVHFEPHLPLVRVLEDVLAAQDSRDIRSGVLRDQTRRQALESVREQVDAELAKLDAFRSPAPPLGIQTTTGSTNIPTPNTTSTSPTT